VRILDRYVVRKFFGPFFFCVLGFVLVWFLADISDNLKNFMKGEALLSQIVEYYRSQIPEVVVMCLPIATLLALLYSLTTMSRHNEIVSMLGAGVSTVRVLVPLFAIGLLLTGVSMYFNYESVPHAAMQREELRRSIRERQSHDKGFGMHLYRNREGHRTWYLAWFYPELNPPVASQVQVLQDDGEGNITEIYYASKVTYDSALKEWVFTKGMYVQMVGDDEERTREMFDTRRMRNWNETPRNIASSVLKAEFLSVPELREYLAHNAGLSELSLARFRTQLQYRWAMPWLCLLTVLLTAPFGIIYSRRGVLAGVTVALFLFFSLVFVGYASIAFGMGGYIPPYVAAWGPLAVYFAIGIFLLWVRATNRDLSRWLN